MRGSLLNVTKNKFKYKNYVEPILDVKNSMKLQE